MTESGSSSHVRVLVVDDDRLTRALHRGILAKEFDVFTAASGAEAIALCEQHLPSLVVVDVEMPGLNGYETCRKLRQWSTVPVIFVTSHGTIEEQLKAYDAGGNVLFTKPVNANILLRHASVVIRQHQASLALDNERNQLQQMAMSMLSTNGQNGTLMNFMRSSVICPGYDELARQLLQATGELGVRCSVRIRHPEGFSVVTDHGEASPLEQSIFDHVTAMGRVFQFKRRLVVNYDRVSIIVANMPDQETASAACDTLRDNLVILAETAEALVLGIDIKKEAQGKAEQMQLAQLEAEKVLCGISERHRLMLIDTRILLQELAEEVEKTYAWLGTSQAQEATISSTMIKNIQRIQHRLSQDSDFSAQFAEVLGALQARQDAQAIELF